ncbi:LapA family protein [Deinococcus sp.]|uniref:LapA family protein n=1 Tax=Deinococcus sp. TaxID=47478 RepID=UPI003B5B4A77
MRLVQFLQVLLLLLLGGYLLLVSLENPGMVRLPLPFLGGEVLLPTGLALGAALLVGATYCALLLLPPLFQLRRRLRTAKQRRREAEERLQLTLRSRLGQPGVGEAAPLSVQPSLQPPPTLIRTEQMESQA